MELISFTQLECQNFLLMSTMGKYVVIVFDKIDFTDCGSSPLKTVPRN